MSEKKKNLKQPKLTPKGTRRRTNKTQVSRREFIKIRTEKTKELKIEKIGEIKSVIWKDEQIDNSSQSHQEKKREGPNQ